jgi:hypothetical protein
MTPDFPQHTPDWSRLVSLDFETYWAADYTLSKSSTSEYVRDKRFKAQMMGIKVGNEKTRIVLAKNIGLELAKINWATHSLLCHNTAFDGFILHHHYQVHPCFYYDSLSMARGLHSNDIGAGLDAVSTYYGGAGKIDGSLEKTQGVLVWDKAMNAELGVYCANDVDEMLRVFKAMLPKMPADEIELIDLTMMMFCDPVLKVDIPRVEAELTREISERKELLSSIVDLDEYDMLKILKVKKDRELPPAERDELMVKKIIGSSDRFADLIRAEGIEPPVKISPAWMKLDKAARESEEGMAKKYAFAFAKDDIKFVDMPNMCDEWEFDLNKPDQVKMMVARQERLQNLVDARIMVKSTSNITRAERFLTAGANGMPLPIGYAYYRAHTGRFGGNNKMNFQNLKRGGELRLSIMAPKGHKIAVVDSGQIECRVNAWLWGQDDLTASFRVADKWDKKTMGVATGENRDAYCKFADMVYGREITTADSLERFVGKVCLGPDTTVLTNHGLKSIIEVRSNDMLWDGESWVTHEGLVDQGRRTTLTCRGMSATPDHEILTGRGWQEWQEVLTDPTLMQSALSLASLPSYAGSTTSLGTESLGATGQFADVHAEQSRWSIQLRSEMDALRGATHARRLQQAQSDTGNTGMLCRMTSIAHACLTVCRQRLADVVTRAMRPISITANVGYQSILLGQSTALSSYGMSRLCLDGTNQNLSSTGLTTMMGTDRATSGLQPSQSTPETSGVSKTSNSEYAISKQTTQTYDLANAGPNHQFTVITDDGPVIVHNCVLGLGYMMGAAKLQITFAKGALGGPPVYFELEKCQGIVNAYRQANYKIIQGWKICDRIIVDMADGREGSHGPLHWEANTIWLPNGMALKYPDLQKAMGEKGWPEWSYASTLKGVPIRKKIYSGLLNENIVQALARIIVMWQMLQASKKYRVVMTTHDEFACIAKNAQADKCFAFMTYWMKTAPEWCWDIPLNSEGKVDVNYSK